MAFHGLTFPNQNVSSLDDRGFYRSFRGDGIIQGCEMSFTNDSITIQAGWLIACGGLVQIDGATIINFDEIPTSGYGRVMLQIDTSQASTAEDFAQLSYLIDYSASIDGFTAPVQEDINLGTGTIYQVVLAIAQISGGNITGVERSLPASNIVGNRNINLFGDETQVLLYDADGNPYGVFGGFTNQPYVEVAKRLDNGSRVTGLRLASSQSNSSIWYGDGGNMVIRPNGVGDSSGQWYVSANGQMHNGTLVYNASVSNKNCPANANTEILRIANLSSITGKYLIFCYLTVTMASTNTGGAYVNMYKNDSIKLGWDLKNWITRSGPSFMTGAIFCTNPSNVVIKFEPSVQASVTGTLDLIDIG